MLHQLCEKRKIILRQLETKKWGWNGFVESTLACYIWQVIPSLCTDFIKINRALEAKPALIFSSPTPFASRVKITNVFSLLYIYSSKRTIKFVQQSKGVNESIQARANLGLSLSLDKVWALTWALFYIFESDHELAHLIIDKIILI